MTDEEDQAAEDYLRALNGLSITPIRDNPMDTTCKVIKDEKKYENGPDKVRAVGDPYRLYERSECSSSR